MICQERCRLVSNARLRRLRQAYPQRILNHLCDHGDHGVRSLTPKFRRTMVLRKDRLEFGNSCEEAKNSSHLAVTGLVLAIAYFLYDHFRPRCDSIFEQTAT